jgi:type VI secretion system protein ImpA
MASPLVLQVEPFLTPLPQGGAGDPAAFRDLRGEFEALIREEDPNSFPEGDPRRVNPRKADWPGVVKLAREGLANRSRDLRVAAWLTVGLAHVEGFAGLRDGLHLLERLVSECWDRVHPPFDPRDPEERGEGLANILDTEDGEPRFPGRVRLLPIAQGDLQVYGAYHLGGGSRDGSLDGEDLELARGRLSSEECRNLAEDIGQGLQELDKLRSTLTARTPSRPPTFNSLRAALEECLGIVEEIHKGKLPTAPAAPTATEDGSGAAGAGAVPTGDVVAARDKVYKQLIEAAALLEKLEGKSSPIPLLIRKVARWGRMSFLELHQAEVLALLTQVVIHKDSEQES